MSFYFYDEFENIIDIRTLNNSKTMELKRSGKNLRGLCDHSVFVKNGQSKQAHLAHYSNSECLITKEGSGGESETHLYLKHYIAQIVNKAPENTKKWKVKTEIPSSDRSVIADLLCTSDKGDTVCVEIQISPQTEDVIIRRNEERLKFWDRVIWLVTDESMATPVSEKLEVYLVNVSDTMEYKETIRWYQLRGSLEIYYGEQSSPIEEIVLQILNKKVRSYKSEIDGNLHCFETRSIIVKALTKFEKVIPEIHNSVHSQQILYKSKMNAYLRPYQKPLAISETIGKNISIYYFASSENIPNIEVGSFYFLPWGSEMFSMKQIDRSKPYRFCWANGHSSFKKIWKRLKPDSLWNIVPQYSDVKGYYRVSQIEDLEEQGYWNLLPRL